LFPERKREENNDKRKKEKKMKEGHKKEAGNSLGFFSITHIICVHPE
jgi:hypothetical protein